LKGRFAQREQEAVMAALDLAPHNPNGLELRAPVLAASGCLGYGLEYARLIALEAIGALVTPTTSLRARRTAAPRLSETPAGLIHSGVWADRGLDYVLDRCIVLWREWTTPVLLSIAAEAHSAVEIVRHLEEAEGLAGLELLGQPEQLAPAIAAIRPLTLLPLIAKLPAHANNPAELARSAVAAGADALVVAAPQPAVWFHTHTGERIDGWLCGPAWQPLALRLVAQVAAAVDVPVVGSGGIASVEDARRFLAAGARAVQIGSALLNDVELIVRVSQELAAPRDADQAGR
jgi:dihydroorotate dehydrogenase (NAD+) catalytic subunit